MMRIPAHRILCCGGNRQIHMDYRVLWGKRDGTATLSRGEHPDPCLDRLLLLFWPITLRMILIYYAQVRFGWLPFTESKGEDVANCIKEERYLQMQREKWLNWLHSSVGGLA